MRVSLLLLVVKWGEGQPAFAICWLPSGVILLDWKIDRFQRLPIGEYLVERGGGRET